MKTHSRQLRTTTPNPLARLLCQAPYPALSGLHSFVFSFPCLWPHSCLSVVISCTRCSIFHSPCQLATPSYPRRNHHNYSCWGKRKGVRKAPPSLKLSPPFPGLLTSISFTFLLLTGLVGIFPKTLTCIISLQSFQAGWRQVLLAARSWSPSFPFNNKGFYYYFASLLQISVFISLCLRVVRLRTAPSLFTQPPKPEVTDSSSKGWSGGFDPWLIDEETRDFFQSFGQ